MSDSSQAGRTGGKNVGDQHVLIIGAGPGGLAAAMLLARSGVRVTVLERRNQVGGRTSTLRTEEGFQFDLGPTFFLYPEVLKSIFEICGRDLHAEVPMKRLDPQYHLLFESPDGSVGGDLKCTSDLDTMCERVATLSPQDVDAFRTYLDDNRRKFAAFKPVLEQPFNGLRDCMTPNTIKSLPMLRPWASVDSDLRKHFSDDRIRLAFSFQAKYLGMSPFKCPSLFTILSFLEYEYGVWHPIGGCGAVSEAMARIATDMGVDIRLDQPVEEVLMDGRRAVGVRTKTEEIRADALVVNADFAHAMQKLVPNAKRRRWTDPKLAKKKYSCSTFMMYLGVDIPPEQMGLEHHSIFLAHDYPKNLDEIENQQVLSANPSTYVCHPGATDSTMAPARMSSLYVLAPTTHKTSNVDWAQEDSGFRQTVMNQIAKFGPKDLADHIRYEKVVNPVNWEHDYAIYKGATFNLAHNFGQMLQFRPRNRFEDLDGVYLTGGGTHPGSGLPVIYQSALISTELLLEDLGLSKDWRYDVGAPPPAAVPLDEPARESNHASLKPVVVTSEPTSEAASAAAQV